MTGLDAKKCPFCAEEIRAEAIKCRFCGSFIEASPLTRAVTRAWYRSRRDKAVAGVCMGIARQFNLSVTLIRLAFLLAAFIGGWGLIIYVALWLIMPKEPETRGVLVEPRPLQRFEGGAPGGDDLPGPR